MNNQQQALLFTVLLSSVGLGGCDTVRNTLGIDHQSPREWDTAEPSPALILPPDYATRPTLPAPRPGETNPYVVSTTQKAQKTVLGEVDPAASDTFQAEADGQISREVVDKASENQEVTPDIRKLVDDESQIDTTVSGKVISKINSWKKEAVDNLTMSKSNKADLEESQNKKGK